jgi:hypothetical protein
MARVEWLTVGGPVEPWQRLGLAVVDGLVALFGTSVRIDPGRPPGLVSWALSGVDADITSIDGVPTEVVGAMPPVFAEHPLGAIGLDHVVVSTDSLERTCRTIEDATGSPLKRLREVGQIRQGFHRIGGGGLIVEVVEQAGLPAGPATLWGLVLNVEDIDAAVALIGEASIGDARPAVQPGRSIATVRSDAGLGLPVALMSP